MDQQRENLIEAKHVEIELFMHQIGDYIIPLSSVEMGQFTALENRDWLSNFASDIQALSCLYLEDNNQAVKEAIKRIENNWDGADFDCLRLYTNEENGDYLDSYASELNLLAELYNGLANLLGEEE